MTLLILMPMSWLVSKSFATARMAMPIFVWLMSHCSSSTSTITSTGVMTVTQCVDAPRIVTVPDTNGSDGYVCGWPPVAYSATFCSR